MDYNNYKREKFYEIKEEVLTKVHSLYFDKKYKQATEIATRFIEEKYYFKSIRTDDRKEIWYYSDGIYSPDGISIIKEELRDLFQDNFSREQINNVIDKIEADTFIDADDFYGQQNKNVYLIPVQNGILNIKTKKLEEFTPNYYFFNKLPMGYYPLAECPEIIKFITQITTKNKEKQQDAIDTIQEMFGFCLLKKYKYSKAFMLEGKKGSNGKSVLCGLLKKFLNEKNVSSINITALDKIDGFALAGLHNKLVNISAELNKEALDNKGHFKQLTGGEDIITANRKNKIHIQFVNYAKMIFTANELPIPKNADEGFWRRWVRIEFPNKYLSKKEFNYLTEEEKEECFFKDENLIEKITTDDELNGLLIWALKGLDQLSINGDFSLQKSIKQNKLEWERKTNSILCFVQDMVKEDFDSYITKEELRREYSIYCKSHNIRPMGDKAIKYCLENEMFAEDTQIRIKDERGYEIDKPRIWKGVSFINKKSPVTGVTPVTPNFTPYATATDLPANLKHPVTPVTPVTEEEEIVIKPNTSILNSILPNEKYSFTTLLELFNLSQKELEKQLKQHLTVGDLMIVDGKYMLVE